MTVERIAEIEISILLLSAFLRVARVGAVRRISFDCMITSCKSSGAILRVLLLLIKDGFLLVFSGFLTAWLLIQCWFLLELRVFVRLTFPR